MKKALTLLELMVAIVVLGLIILAANSSELSTRVFLNRELSKFILVKNATYALDRIIKTVRMASSATSTGSGLVLHVLEPQEDGTKIDEIIRYTLNNKEIRYDDNFLNSRGTLIGDVKSFQCNVSGKVVVVTLEVESQEKQKQSVKLTSYGTMQNQ